MAHFEMVFALDGCVEVSVDDNCYSLQKNEMALITPYSSHSFKTVSSSRIIVIEFPTSYIREYKKLFLGKEFKKTVMPTPETVRDCIKELISEDGGDDFMKISLIYRTFSEYMRKNEMVDRTGISSDVFRRAVEYIHEHFCDRDLTVELLAKMCSMSDTYFRKLFKQRFKVTPLKYINDLKVKYATELLRSGYYTVTEAAEKCGFDNVYYFSLFIKKETGLSPSQI